MIAFFPWEQLSTIHAISEFRNDRKCKYIFIFLKINPASHGSNCPTGSYHQLTLSRYLLIFNPESWLVLSVSTCTLGPHTKCMMCYYRAITERPHWPLNTANHPTLLGKKKLKNVKRIWGIHFFSLSQFIFLGKIMKLSLLEMAASGDVSQYKNDLMLGWQVIGGKNIWFYWRNYCLVQLFV